MGVCEIGNVLFVWVHRNIRLFLYTIFKCVCEDFSRKKLLTILYQKKMKYLVPSVLFFYSFSFKYIHYKKYMR